jgi:hypothetical protein
VWVQSFAQLYSDLHGVDMDSAAFASKLWGDIYYHSDTRGEPAASRRGRNRMGASRSVSRLERPPGEEAGGSHWPPRCSAARLGRHVWVWDDSFAHVCRFAAAAAPADLPFWLVCAAFKRKPAAGGGERSFVQFILEPLYKLYSQIIGEHRKAVEATLAQLGVALKPSGQPTSPQRGKAGGASEAQRFLMRPPLDVDSVCQLPPSRAAMGLYEGI